jgi:zinc protease
MTARTALAAVLASASAILLFGSATAQTIQLPKSKTEALANGLKVTLAEQHTVPLIEVRMRIPAGVAYEPEGQEGLARITAELLTQGTEKHSATEIATALDQIGATLSTSATPDYLLVSMSTLARHRSAALALLAECIVTPTFPDPEVERIRSRQLAMLEQQGEDPGGLADLALWHERFAGDPYGRRPDGGKSTVAKITAAEIRDFHRTRIVPRGSVLVAVGDFDPGAMRKELSKLFSGWQGGPPPAPPTSVTTSGASGSQVVLVHKPELVQSQVRIGYPGLPRGHANEAPLQVASTILGGGFTSRLVEAIRIERSLGYFANCQSVQEGRTGVVGIATATKTPTTRQTVDVALAEVDRFLKEGPGDEELTGVKSYLSGSIARSLQSPADIAQSLSAITFYGLPEDYVARRLERIRAVAKPDLQRVMGEHFTPSGRTIVVVADATAVRDSLAAFGTMKEVRFESLLE